MVQGGIYYSGKCLSAGSMTRASAILATSPDLLQDQQELKKQIDNKLVSYLRVLPFQGGATGTYRHLSRAIREKSHAAVVGLLLSKNALTSLTPVQIEKLYEKIPDAIEDRLLRSKMVEALTWCLKERGKLHALKLAAGKLNDTPLMLWVIKNAPQWNTTQLMECGWKEAARFGNVSGVRLGLGRYVCAPLHRKIWVEAGPNLHIAMPLCMSV